MATYQHFNQPTNMDTATTKTTHIHNSTELSSSTKFFTTIHFKTSSINTEPILQTEDHNTGTKCYTYMILYPCSDIIGYVFKFIHRSSQSNKLYI